MPPQEDCNNDLQEPLLETPGEACTSTDALDAQEEEASKNLQIPCAKHVEINHNVLINLILAVLYGISGSLWNGTAYAAYLKDFGRNSNTPVGVIEAVGGVSTLLTALPIGYLADRLGRAKVIRAGGVLLVVTALLQIVAIEWAGTPSDADAATGTHHTHIALVWMGVIMAFWGVGDGVVNGPCTALFADSTKAGERSKYYNYLFLCYSAASAVGPLLAIILFETLGDDWDLKDLRFVIYAGLFLELFNSFIMMLFDDRKALNEDDDEGTQQQVLTQGETNAEQAPDSSATQAPAQAENMQTNTLTPMQQRQQWIPYIIFVQSLIFALGSGMTIKFFPLFFKDEVGMSPSQVQLIFFCVPFVMAACSTVGEKISSAGFGRAQTTLLFSSLGVGLLYCMVFFKSYLDSHPIVLVPIYILRSSFMNGSYPLVESIMMDYVPKNQRARWASLEAVTSLGWSGSAAFGGWLADKYDYTYTFLFTAILQTIGTLFWVALLPLVPRTEGVTTPEDSEEASPSNTEDDYAEDHGTLQDPLISQTE